MGNPAAAVCDPAGCRRDPLIGTVRTLRIHGINVAVEDIHPRMPMLAGPVTGRFQVVLLWVGCIENDPWTAQGLQTTIFVQR